MHVAAMLNINEWWKCVVIWQWDKCIWCYVSIISDCISVRSITIHQILQSNGSRNNVGSIRHVSSFHLERYDKMIKIVYCVIHINFPIKSTDSCWKLRRETSRKLVTKYKLRSIKIVKLRSIVKKFGLKKIKTINILADCLI